MIFPRDHKASYCKKNLVSYLTTLNAYLFFLIQNILVKQAKLTLQTDQYGIRPTHHVP